MKNNTLFFHPQNLPSKTFWWSPSEIQERIIQIIENKDFIDLQKSFLNTWHLLFQTIQDESEKIGYDYVDYDERLTLSDNALKKIWDDFLLTHPTIKKQYEDLLRCTPNSDITQKRLWNEVFKDFALEIWTREPNDSPPIFLVDFATIDTPIPPDATSISLRNIHQDGTPESIWPILRSVLLSGNITNAMFNFSPLWAFDDWILNMVFSHLQNLKWIDLNYSLRNITPSKLHTIFPYLEKFKILRLGYNDLWKLDEKHLHAIFSHLTHIKRIELYDNDIWVMDQSRIHAIFSYLWNLRNINLMGNNLQNLDAQNLSILFSHLKSLKSTILSNNFLQNANEQKLEAIFSNLSHIQSIDLGNNNVWVMSEMQLLQIFPHLRNIRHITLEWNGLWNLSISCLNTLFSSIQNATSIDLWDNHVWELDVEKLNAIFSHFHNLNTTGLWRINLYLLDAHKLHTVFSHLGVVERINLSQNSLYSLNDTQLNAIFSHLHNLQSLTISESENFVLRLESLFPYLKGKINSSV